ncbi:hypothetical protein KUTeg_002513 [Tegillarca granosa]|uniref:Alpha-catulin n=1 Tax=Tegillarca granosa TaxID=220873 RepID=A0ABQ9FW05_TEGGR|nr:hypothetical protein KUTeg_002513 [Tegillarca granosa]
MLCIDKRMITTLVNHKDKARVTERTIKALVRVGQTVSLAVERFVCVGQSIAEENEEIRTDMCEACQEARMAGESIQKLTSTDYLTSQTHPKSFTEKTAMVRAARQLLSAITRVLLLADRVIVKQLLVSRDKTCLRHPDCESARRNRDGVFRQMRLALDLIHHVVTDGGSSQMNGHSSPISNGDSGIGLDNAHPSSNRSLKEFEKDNPHSQDLETAILKTASAAKCLKKQVCKLFRHIAPNGPLVIAAEHNESIIRSIGPLTLYAAKTLSVHPGSKIARENLDVFSDAWESQINDLSVLVKEVNDVCQGRMADKPVYLSLPRPGVSVVQF